MTDHTEKCIIETVADRGRTDGFDSEVLYKWDYFNSKKTYYNMNSFVSSVNNALSVL